MALKYVARTFIVNRIKALSNARADILYAVEDNRIPTTKEKDDNAEIILSEYVNFLNQLDKLIKLESELL